jgi:hypothetical protein
VWSDPAVGRRFDEHAKVLVSTLSHRFPVVIRTGR